MTQDNVTRLHDDPAERVARHLAEGAKLNLREQLLKLKRRKLLIALVVAVVTAATWAIVDHLEPQYQANAYVMIEPPRSRLLTKAEDVTDAMPPDVETIQGELAVIKSRGLAERVINKLALDTLPEFNPVLAEKEAANHFSVGRWLTGVARGTADLARGALGLPPLADELNMLAGASEERLKNRVINAFLDKLDANPRGRSRVIEISFTSNDPRRASEIANTVAALYINEQLEAKFEAAQRVANWLTERIATLHDRSEGADRAVAAFRKEAGLLQVNAGAPAAPQGNAPVQGAGTTLASQEISQVETDLVTARGVRAEAEARLHQADRTVDTAGDVNVSNTVLQSPLIQNLTAQKIAIQRNLAELASQYGERHPRIIGLRNDLGDLETRIRTEIAKIGAGLRNEVGVARSREETLAAELDRLKAHAGQLGQAEVQLRSLQAEADSARTLLNTVLNRFNETNIQQNVQQPDARIISPAAVPREAAFPNKKLIVGMALVLSAILGVMIAFCVEHLDQGFRSSEQIGQLTGLATLGIVPLLGRWAGRVRQPHEYFLSKPRSTYSEAISTVVAGLFMSGHERRPRIVMVTSSVPNEGKTSTAINLARAIAQSGMRTLLIDADLRRPSLHGIFGFKKQHPGLVDLLSERVAFAEAVQRDPKTKLEVLTAGSAVANPLHFLAAERTRTFIQGLSKYYDLVVIDSSPVMVVSDPRIMSRYVDETLFVVRWARTRREHVLLSLKHIFDAGGQVGGIVLSMVNVHRHAQYAFSDSGQYRIGQRYYEA